MNDITSVEFEGINYPIIFEKLETDRKITYKFKTTIDEKERTIKAEYSTALREDLFKVHGYDIDIELKKILIEEIKSEIFQYIYDTKIKDQHNKISFLIENLSALDKSMKDDSTFEAYVRNFYPELYTYVRNFYPELYKSVTNIKVFSKKT